MASDRWPQLSLSRALAHHASSLPRSRASTCPPLCTHTLEHTLRHTLTPPSPHPPGDYDTYVRTRSEQDENQMKKYKWEQEQIANMKDYIARFGHGSAKLARQAQVRAGEAGGAVEGG